MRITNEACLGVLPGTFIACGEHGYCSNECALIGAFDCGAAVAFGLLGMAEAIRANAPPLVVRHYWTSEIDGRHFYECYCANSCGTYLKGRHAGRDEGTDAEYCGACR
jgi:hypothetical protein